MTQPNIAARLAEAAAAESLEALTRPLLELLHEVTGLESTYLTRVDTHADEQVILFSRNVGDIEIPEGLRVEWGDTLCKRALESGVPCTADVPSLWGDSEAAAALGLQTYVSTPVRLPDGTLFGTLCGASGQRRGLDDDKQRLLSMFARLVADQVARERARTVERERAERAEERLRARAEMLAMAEHELKSPLAILLGWSTILKENTKGLDEQMRETGIETIHRAAERLRGQIDRMLEEARAEVIARDLQMLRLDLVEEVRSTAGMFASAAEAREVVFEGSDRAVAVVDRNALFQIVSHLIENALKYSPAGSRVEVSVRTDGEQVVLAVSDQGPGIPESIDIFQPFSRGEDRTTTGVGLGLHIVRTLVESMDGEVSARRNPEVGSTFEARFPVA